MNSDLALVARLVKRLDSIAPMTAADRAFAQRLAAAREAKRVETERLAGVRAANALAATAAESVAPEFESVNAYVTACLDNDEAGTVEGCARVAARTGLLRAEVIAAVRTCGVRIVAGGSR